MFDLIKKITGSAVAKIASVNKGSANLVGDWFRVAGEDALIDDISVKDYKKTYGNFQDINSVKMFLQNIILEKIDQNSKEGALEYLTTAFHQGGLMNPVSSALSEHFTRKLDGQPDANLKTRQLRIIPTQTGFKVQEIFTLYKAVLLSNDRLTPDLKAVQVIDNVRHISSSCGLVLDNTINPAQITPNNFNSKIGEKIDYRDAIISINNELYDANFKDKKLTKIPVTRKNYNEILEACNNAPNKATATDKQLKKIAPLTGRSFKPFLLEAGACIDVNFTENAKEPKITVESSFISYGHNALKSALDERTIGEIIIDFFRRVLGLNAVEIVKCEDSNENRMNI